jgi:glutaredoxin 2
MKKLIGNKIRGIFATIPFSLASRLLSKMLNINIYKNIILPVVFYVYETCPLTIRKEHIEGV